MIEYADAPPPLVGQPKGGPTSAGAASQRAASAPRAQQVVQGANDLILSHQAVGARTLKTPAGPLAEPSGSSSSSSKAQHIERADIGPSSKRYLILLLFCLHSAINSMQWIYLSSVTNVVAQFYQVNSMAVNWTSMIYMLVYIPLVVPASWLFERIGMRNSVLLGSLGTTLGALIKCLCCRRGRFGLLMLGQTIVAASQLFVLSVPPRLAAVWFPDHQVSLANACGVFGNQLGIALGFVLPQLLLIGEGPPIESELLALFLGIALSSGAVSLLILILFDQAPSRAPGQARLQQMRQEQQQAAAGDAPELEASPHADGLEAEVGALTLVLEPGSGGGSSGGGGGGIQAHSTAAGGKAASALPPPTVAAAPAAAAAKHQRGRGRFCALLGELLSEPNFLRLMAGYGLNVGVFYAISTVLNQMLVPLWAARANSLVARLGLLMIIAGMFGALLSGLLLDRTRRYRLVNASLYGLSLLSLIAFALAIERRDLLQLHLAALLLGYSMTGYLFIGYEMSNEITWPRPESVTAGLLNLSAQIFGIVLTYAGSHIVDSRGALMANLFFVLALVAGLLITLTIRTQLKRQRAMDS